MSYKLKVEEAFGRVIRRHRQKLGLTQEKLSELADLHRTYVSQIERGLKSPSLKALMALAQALNIEPHILIYEMENDLNDSI